MCQNEFENVTSETVIDEDFSNFDNLHRPSLHTNTYYENVTNRLRSAESREDVLEILNQISKELQEGTFPK